MEKREEGTGNLSGSPPSMIYLESLDKNGLRVGGESQRNRDGLKGMDKEKEQYLSCHFSN